MDLNKLAESSPTAAALLKNINAEVAEADAQRRKQELDEADRARNERLKFIHTHNQACADALATYDSLRQQAEAALMTAFVANASLPSGVVPQNPLAHLSHVHLPPGKLAPLDPIHPSFTSMRCLLMARGLG